MNAIHLIFFAIVLFIGANIDDLFNLILFFSDTKFKTAHIVIGEYLAFIAIILISLLGGSLVLLIKGGSLRLLGILPIYVGVNTYFKLKEEEKTHQPNKPTAGSNVLKVFLLSFAFSSDNIAVLIPVFAEHSTGQNVIIVSTFIPMVLFWCWLAAYFIRHPKYGKFVEKYIKIFAPLILIGLGIYILLGF